MTSPRCLTLLYTHAVTYKHPTKESVGMRRSRKTRYSYISIPGRESNLPNFCIHVTFLQPGSQACGPGLSLVTFLFSFFIRKIFFLKSNCSFNLFDYSSASTLRSGGRQYPSIRSAGDPGGGGGEPGVDESVGGGPAGEETVGEGASRRRSSKGGVIRRRSQ